MKAMHFIKTTCLLICLFSLYLSNAFGQTSPHSMPAAYKPGSVINYVRTWEMIAPVSNPDSIHTSTPISKARMTTQYIDGLGRPVQTVMKQGAFNIWEGDPVDLVTTVEYDEFGREQFGYLPFVANNAGANSSIDNGLFKLNPFEQYGSFMQSQYPEEQWTLK